MVISEVKWLSRAGKTSKGREPQGRQSSQRQLRDGGPERVNSEEERKAQRGSEGRSNFPSNRRDKNLRGQFVRTKVTEGVENP